MDPSRAPMLRRPRTTQWQDTSPWEEVYQHLCRLVGCKFVLGIIFTRFKAVFGKLVKCSDSCGGPVCMLGPFVLGLIAPLCEGSRGIVYHRWIGSLRKIQDASFLQDKRPYQLPLHSKGLKNDQFPFRNSKNFKLTWTEKVPRDPESPMSISIVQENGFLQLIGHRLIFRKIFARNKAEAGDLSSLGISVFKTLRSLDDGPSVHHRYLADVVIMYHTDWSADLEEL